MMISLYCALSLFLVLRLSEGYLFIHPDCGANAALFESKFQKTVRRINTLSQEMSVLGSVSQVQGNLGLQRTASYLFDPLATFFNVAQNTASAASGGRLIFTDQGYHSSAGASDTIIRCSSDGFTKTSKGDYYDHDTLDVSIIQDPDNIKGCYFPPAQQGYLNVFVTVPEGTDRPSIIRLCPGFRDREIAKSTLPPTVPARQCRQLQDSRQLRQQLSTMNAKMAVDLAVSQDPYYEYERAMYQTGAGLMNNGGQSWFATPNKWKPWKTPSTDG